jgi:hypothetical protein
MLQSRPAKQGCHTRERPEKNKHAADDFTHADKGSHNRGSGNANLHEAPNAKLVWKEKLLDACGEKNRTQVESGRCHNITKAFATGEVTDLAAAR